ncbi:hypothetical protein LTR37_003867 [Vermiconidia calcicola]|uniref:Uncharacterized protein n=1 Tax=Vermiconidia calcicola TaxID=1690605 RepID=A0ACC3NQP3_9PEZI|nr:hypothetical protein LTR37_003867 [Vermiconidia calcicola]
MRPASQNENIHLQIGLKQRNEGVVEQHLIEISDPNHARYGQHLSVDEIHDIISPSADTITLVHAWLLDHNIHDAAFSPSKDWVSVVIPIGKAEKLLQTSYKEFKHDEDGSTLSRAPEWSLPLHLHDHIDVVQPTTSFFRAARDQNLPRQQDASVAVERREITAEAKRNVEVATEQDSIDDICSVHLTTPRCLRTLYGTINYTPQAPDLNKVGLTNYLNETNRRRDIHLYLKTYRPSIADAAYEFPIVRIANAPDQQGPLTKFQMNNFLQFEGAMDAELLLVFTYPTPMTAYSTGGSPPFQPDLQTPTNMNEPYLTWLNYALAQNDLPQVISTSYGEPEQTVPESYARRVCAGFAQLGARGISLLFGSGDAGVGADGTCYSNANPERRVFLPNFPAGCPWVTSVGATKGFTPEVATEFFASGGGFSNYFKMPQYQKSTVNAYIAGLDGLHHGLYNPTGRGYPDVAAQGNRDAFGWNNRITWNGGTSASCPTFAAVISLVNDALLAKGKPPLGFLNPWLYDVAQDALTDVTGGSSFGCNTTGFPAKDGWDAVTGLGTPNFKALVDAAFEQYGGWDGHGLS